MDSKMYRVMIVGFTNAFAIRAHGMVIGPMGVALTDKSGNTIAAFPWDKLNGVVLDDAVEEKSKPAK